MAPTTLDPVLSGFAQHGRVAIARLGALVFCAASLAFVLASTASGADQSASADSAGKADVNPNVATIRATADNFADAFNSGNAKALAGLWTDDGSLIDESGAIYKGRKAIEDVYAAFFKEYPDARIDIVVGPIEFPSPTTAVEDGISRVVVKDDAAGGTSRYTAVHVKQGGTWKMASVRESSLTPAGGYAKLKELEWLVGTWQTTTEAATVSNSINWIANKNFLQRDYTVTEKGKVISSGTQLIGWDPRLEQLRSWSFDSSGGNGTGVWTPTADGWRIESIGVLANGTPTSSTDYVIHVPGDDSVLGWRSVDRRVGMVQLPDTREVVLDRVTQK